MAYTGYYIVIDRNDAEYETIIADCQEKQDELAPNNNLSISELNDNTSLIKIPGADDEWKDSQSWAASVIIRFLPEEKDERLAYYYERQDV